MALKFFHFFLLISLSLNVCLSQACDPEILNWYNKKSPGMNTEKAYKKVSSKKSKTVIVAVIDSGIDIEHEDLKGKIWTNPKEIPNNKIDDDKNGYIDDIHGWNFLGGSDGKHQQYACLEKTRIYRDYRDKYEKIEPNQVSNSELKEYELYKLLRKEVREEKEQYEQILSQIDMLPMIIKMVPDMVSNAIGKKNYTKKDLEKWKPTDEQMSQIKDLALAIENGELSDEAIKEQKDQVYAMVNYHYNVNYNDREIVGDNPKDFSQKNYGNNDVEGPDALHGTHVGGIIASIRGNNIGNDGVASDVLLMSLRAVPDGDEQDKDIAFAIRYAVDNGAQIINMSFGKQYSPNAKEVYEALKYADSKGVLLVHAAGNENKNIDENEKYPTAKYTFQNEKFVHYLSIGANTRFSKNTLAASFSNFGKVSVDVFAPGHDIFSTVPQSAYKKLNGTSMAAPMVSGAAAFLKSYYSELTMMEIKDILIASAKNYSTNKCEKPGTKELVDFGTLSVSGSVIDLNTAVSLAEKKIKSK
ncbi:MAG: S8 family peptidase [Flavobacteriia bacterium]|nr:S8 family peptidase [Flavobacteriia bacterium]